MKKNITINTEITRENFLHDTANIMSLTLGKPKKTDNWEDIISWFGGFVGPSEYDEYDDDYSYCGYDEDDYWGDFFSAVPSKKKKKKKAKVIPMRPEASFFDTEDDNVIYGKRHNKKKKTSAAFNEDAMELYDSSMNKEIRFYRDYNNQDDYELFTNLYAFDEFCETEGIDVPPNEVQNLIHRDISYCTVNPQKRIDEHTQELLSDSSYGGLKWECATCDDSLEMY